MTSIGAAGGMLPAPDWWPSRQPRAPKPHVTMRRGRWFLVANGKVTWHCVGGAMIFARPKQ